MADVVQWLLAPVAAITGFFVALLSTLMFCSALHDILVGLFCKPGMYESGMCMDPSWVDQIPEDVGVIVGPVLAAGLVVLLGSMTAPSRKRYVPWLFFFGGAAYLLTAGFVLVDAPLDGTLLRAGGGALVSGIVTAGILNRWAFSARHQRKWDAVRSARRTAR